MKEFLMRKRINVALMIIIIIISCAATYFVTDALTSGAEKGSVQTTEALYESAVMDAIRIEEDEIYPLVCIDGTDELVRWNEAADKVLLVSWHRYPDSYIAGESLVLEWGEVWTFTDLEIKQWYQNTAADEGVEDWTLRLKQLIGLPSEKEYTHFTGFWVAPDDILRPAYSTDISVSVMTDQFDEEYDEAYKEWFDGNIVYSYFERQYPWTRLGYTYDWAESSDDYGLTEFIISDGSSVEIEFTYSTEEFLDFLAQ
jgi:hypothetical protein